MKTKTNSTHQKGEKKSYHIMIGVLVTMLLIVTAWGIWFFPSKKLNNEADLNFKGFKRDIIGSFSIFKNKTSKNQEQIDINDLRTRVFGDSVQPE